MLMFESTQVPGRSILKPAAPSQQQFYDGDSTSNFTTTLYTQTQSLGFPSKDGEPASSSDEAEAENTDNIAATTAAMADTTRRLSRRVSFAPTAQMREFSKEDEDYGDESLSNIGASSSPARPSQHQQPQIHVPGLSNSLDSRGISGPAVTASPSPAKSSTSGRKRSSSIRSNGHRRRSSVANAQSLVESFNAVPQPHQETVQSQENVTMDQSLSTLMPVGDESNLLSNESAMSLADTSDVTTAFKSHFVFPTTSSSQQTNDLPSTQEASFAASSANASNVMDMADDDVTSAFALNTHLFGAPSPARNTLFTQPSPARLSAASPFRPSTSQAVSPAIRRRQSHSPSKKIQQQRRESEIKAAWDADAIRRRSLLQVSALTSSTSASGTSSLQVSSTTTMTQEERTHREYHVPLGQEGIDEEDIVQLQIERAKKGSAAFLAARQSIGTSQVSLFGASVEQTDTSVFAMHHGGGHEDGNDVLHAMEFTDGDNGEDQTMDMSIVQDSRRVSNVFAMFANRRASTDSNISTGAARIEEIGEEGEDNSPSPIKTGSLYPSIVELQKETSHLQSPTPGDRALAFLDDEDDDEQYDQTATLEEVPEQTVQASEPVEESEVIPTEDSPLAEEETVPTEAEPTQEEASPQFAPFNVHDFQRHRLSIVPERRDEEEEEEEEEDHTQDMEETGVYGSVIQQAPIRRLSMAHPRASLGPQSAQASPAKSPVKSPRRSSRSPVKRTVPSPAAMEKRASPAEGAETKRKSASPEAVKSKIPPATAANKGRHSLAVPSLPPMAFTSLNEDGPRDESESLFKTVTSGSGIAQPASSSMGMSLCSNPLPSPARPPKSPSMQTGLTPDMRRLISDDGRRKSTLANMLVSPAPVNGLSRLSGRESLAPTSEPFFETEPAPQSENDIEHRPKISLDQFLSLADMQFMDGLLSVSQAPGAGVKRKNTARPSLERGASNPLGGVSLADQISASAAVIPFLEGYRMVCPLFYLKRFQT